MFEYTLEWPGTKDASVNSHINNIRDSLLANRPIDAWNALKKLNKYLAEEDNG